MGLNGTSLSRLHFQPEREKPVYECGVATSWKWYVDVCWKMCKDFKDYFNVKTQYRLCHMYLTEDRYWPKKRFHSSCVGFSRVELVAEHLAGNKCHILPVLIMSSQSASISCEIVTEFSQCDQLVFVHVSHQGPFQLLSLNVWSNLERRLVVTHSISEWLNPLSSEEPWEVCFHFVNMVFLRIDSLVNIQWRSKWLEHLIGTSERVVLLNWPLK